MTRLSLVSDAIVEPTLLVIIAFNHLLGFSISFFDRHQRFVHDLYLCIEFCTFFHLTDMAFHTFEEHATVITILALRRGAVMAYG